MAILSEFLEQLQEVTDEIISTGNTGFHFNAIIQDQSPSSVNSAPQIEYQEFPDGNLIPRVQLQVTSEQANVLLDLVLAVKPDHNFSKGSLDLPTLVNITVNVLKINPNEFLKQVERKLQDLTVTPITPRSKSSDSQSSRQQVEGKAEPSAASQRSARSRWQQAGNPPEIQSDQQLGKIDASAEASQHSHRTDGQLPVPARLKMHQHEGRIAQDTTDYRDAHPQAMPRETMQQLNSRGTSSTPLRDVMQKKSPIPDVDTVSKSIAPSDTAPIAAIPNESLQPRAEENLAHSSHSSSRSRTPLSPTREDQIPSGNDAQTAVTQKRGQFLTNSPSSTASIPQTTQGKKSTTQVHQHQALLETARSKIAKSYDVKESITMIQEFYGTGNRRERAWQLGSTPSQARVDFLEQRISVTPDPTLRAQLITAVAHGKELIANHNDVYSYLRESLDLIQDLSVKSGAPSTNRVARIAQILPYIQDQSLQREARKAVKLGYALIEQYFDRLVQKSLEAYRENPKMSQLLDTLISNIHNHVTTMNNYYDYCSHEKKDQLVHDMLTEYKTLVNLNMDRYRAEGGNSFENLYHVINAMKSLFANHRDLKDHADSLKSIIGEKNIGYIEDFLRYYDSMPQAKQQSPDYQDLKSWCQSIQRIGATQIKGTEWPQTTMAKDSEHKPRRP